MQIPTSGGGLHKWTRRVPNARESDSLFALGTATGSKSRFTAAEGPSGSTVLARDEGHGPSMFPEREIHLSYRVEPKFPIQSNP